MIKILVLILGLFSLNVNADNDQNQLDIIKKMGGLNAVALHCSYTEQMQRIKRELVLHLPKKRSLGDWFEQTTRVTFMEFIQNNEICPPLSIFTIKTGDAIEELENVFKK